ncbi:MAG: DUF3991 domain-containing protein [Ruminococcus sp.]
MAKFIHFTKEELYQAKHSSIKNYLESIGEKVLKSGSEYMWEKHDSVKFREHVFYRHSTGEKGDAVEFLMLFFDFSFQDAVITLLDGRYMANRNTTAIEAASVPAPYHPNSRKIVLPKQNSNNKRLFGYLCGTRKIDYSVVSYFVARKLIYEEASYHNIIYLGRDKTGAIRYAAAKGTSSDRKFQQELRGSIAKYCFRHVGSSNVLFVFEAFVDLLSYITLYHLNQAWHTYNYVALGGLKIEVLKSIVKDFPHVNSIVICTDNDFNSSDGVNHGQQFAYKAQDYLCAEYNVRIDTPYLKDWNEILVKG